MHNTPLAITTDLRAAGVSPAACLASLPAGAWGTVVRLGQQLAHSQRAQLMEMGLVPGTRVGRLQAGCAGGPVVVQLRGYLLTLGRGEAHGVEVVPQPTGA